MGGKIERIPPLVIIRKSYRGEEFTVSIHTQLPIT